MRSIARGLVAASLALAASAAFAADKPVIGIVSISATEANNARYIQGAKKAAEELGYDVNVVDAAGSADQANAAIQNFAQLGVYAIVDMVFPFSSIGAGLDAEEVHEVGRQQDEGAGVHGRGEPAQEREPDVHRMPHNEAIISRNSSPSIGPCWWTTCPSGSTRSVTGNPTTPSASVNWNPGSRSSSYVTPRSAAKRTIASTLS